MHSDYELYALINPRQADAGLEDRIAQMEERQGQQNAKTFNYLLKILDAFDEQQVNDQYMLVGGYAVLGHLIGELGDDAALEWRGSHDLDMVARNKTIEAVLDSTFVEFNKVKSKSGLPNKKSYTFLDEWEQLRAEEIGADSSEEPFGKRVELDLYVANGDDYPSIHGYTFHDKTFDRAKRLEVMGRPLSVASIYDIVHMKLNIHRDSTGLPRVKDITDLYNLMGIMENDGRDPSDVIVNMGRESYESADSIFSTQSYNENIQLPNVLVKPSMKYANRISQAARRQIELL